MSAVAGRRIAAPTIQFLTTRWSIVGMVGTILGLYTMVLTAIPPRWASLLLLAVLFPFVAVMVGNLRKLLLAVILLELPFQLDIYLNYRESAEAFSAIGGLNISVTTLCLAILYALWFSELLARRGHPVSSLLRSSLPLATYLALVGVSVIFAQDVTLALFEFWLLLQAFLLHLYVINWTRTREDVLFIVTFLLLGLLLESLVIIGLKFIGHTISIANITARVHENGRIAGTIGSANTAASYLSLLLAPALSVLMTGSSSKLKTLAGLAFGLGGIALLLTLSRGGWLAFTLSISLLGLAAWHRGRLSSTALLTIGVVILLLILPFHSAILNRILGDDGGSAYARIPLIKLALRIIRDFPLVGVGPNNFHVVVLQYVTPEFSRQWLSTAHNKYMLVWSETGPGALLAFVWFLTSVIRRGWQCWRRNDALLAPLGLGFAVAITGQMIHMAVELFNSRPQVQILWLIAGLVVAMGRLEGVGANHASDQA